MPNPGRQSVTVLTGKHKTDAGVFQIFFEKTEMGNRTDNNPAVDLISGLHHKDIEI